ncbi:unnamed protein product [Spodoptera littoralis]|uniref:Uncharacterized protein n=1 Tax=Spodoptera littoralis TaxID=7109 RepID=A0A9P0IAA5_SPOLI|nr:unnamed protein product [Spodoptera littoralis]CAH1643045.1 unnamed protein product [Spodoptera littoralis]
MVLERFVWSEEVEKSTEMGEQPETGRDSVEPELEAPEILETETSVDEEDGALKDLLRVDEQYVPLLTLLEQFSPGEDGIQFNRKLKHFETTVSSVCPDDSRVQQAFATFRAAALLNPAMARKLAAVGSCFKSQLQLRRTFLNVVLQETFAKLDVLERSNPKYLVNATSLMGDYFAGARLSDGQRVIFLAEPLLRYLRALLACQDILAHRTLATQLMQNGRELLSILPQEIDELSISIRLRLLSSPPVSTTWLLLSADLCLNKFLALPNILQQFYADHLEITTSENSEVSYGSCTKGPEMDVDQPQSTAAARQSKEDRTASVRRNKYDAVHSKIDMKSRLDLNSWRQPNEEVVKQVCSLHKDDTTKTRIAQRNLISAGRDKLATWTARNNLRRRYRRGGPPDGAVCVNI